MSNFDVELTPFQQRDAAIQRAWDEYQKVLLVVDQALADEKPMSKEDAIQFKNGMLVLVHRLAEFDALMQEVAPGWETGLESALQC